MEVTRNCMLTGKQNTLTIPGLTQEMLDASAAGALAQDAFVGISADHREFIMTGILPCTWDAHFPEEDWDE